LLLTFEIPEILEIIASPNEPENLPSNAPDVMTSLIGKSQALTPTWLDWKQQQDNLAT